MKFIKELLEDAGKDAGLGYYIVGNNDNDVVDGPFEDKSTAEKNKKQYYKDDGKNTYSIKFGNVTGKGYFILASKAHTVTEDAAAGAVSGGDVAGMRSSLFGGPIIKRKVPNSEKVTKIKFSNRANWNIRESFMAKLLEFADEGGKFNSADVISKLTAAEKQHDFDRNSTPFGIEDEEGRVVKVYVRPDQAEEFERALGSTVADTAINGKEIAEILFNLKDSFDIIHVEWPPLPEDEEEDVALAGNEGEGDLEMTDDAGTTDLGAGDVGATDLGAGAPEEDTSVKSALDKVIDMLKSDAEARKAEADAKAQEAKAKEAEYAAKMAEQKVKSEEEVLDMETFYKNKTDDRKEAQKLMKLAKYRHGLAREAGEELE